MDVIIKLKNGELLSFISFNDRLFINGLSTLPSPSGMREAITPEVGNTYFKRLNPNDVDKLYKLSEQRHYDIWAVEFECHLLPTDDVKSDYEYRQAQIQNETYRATARLLRKKAVELAESSTS